MPYTVERYAPSMAAEWDDFVSRARNATFLFRRGYMDYHADRFNDFSLVARDGSQRIVALLPANAAGDRIESHGGLTYGGWIGCYRHFDVISLLEIQNAASRYLSDCGFRELLYKPLPYIYCDIPSEEDRYVIFRNGGRLESSQVSTVIALDTDMGPDATRRRKARHAAAAGVAVDFSDDLAAYWKILEEVLRQRHGAAPVHTLAEMEMLRRRFPDNIRLLCAFKDGEIVAGTLLYESGRVVRTQYIAAGDAALGCRALDLLLVRLTEMSRDAGYRWLDFGTSNLEHGHLLNEGLVRQKITLGGRAVVFDRFAIPLTHPH